MRLLVTGGLGAVGRPVVRRLLENGHQVRVVDRQAGECVEGVECIACDITDFSAVREQVRGQEAIIHLAAIPAPMMATGEEIFRINGTGTFNVYEAAAQEGIRRIATASSINWLGFYYGVRNSNIRYFPVDEDHPNFTTDAYSFSKQVTEDIAAYYWRREGISSTCLRMPGVFEQREEWIPRRKEWIAQTRKVFAELADRTPEERAAWLNQLLEKTEGWRARRWLEMSFEERQRQGMGMDDPDVRFASSRLNFWALLDGRDAAQAFEKSILADFEGCHPLFVNDRVNTTGIESETLLGLFFPEVTARKHPLVGAEALVSIDKARQLIGFEPEYTFAKWFSD
jgi:NAD(P)-dependent dehydrogenase (short-subunit alcohol dehydrogenase family)